MIHYDYLGWDQQLNAREARIGYGYVSAGVTDIYTMPFTNKPTAYSLDAISGNTGIQHVCSEWPT